MSSDAGSEPRLGPDLDRTGLDRTGVRRARMSLVSQHSIDSHHQSTVPHARHRNINEDYGGGLVDASYPTTVTTANARVEGQMVNRRSSLFPSNFMA